ncbi:MAG: hypothetical protein R2764_08650 [Bacteroidales bacterium]
MKKYSIGIVCLMFIMIFESCDTEFETIAEWRDIPVVYGILGQHQAVQNIKINKAFMGEGNALEYAQNPDSIYYPYGLEVWVEEWSETGTFIRAIQFDTATIEKEETGIFGSTQIIYRSLPYNYHKIRAEYDFWGNLLSIDTFWLNETSKYKLIIDNPFTGIETYSETLLVRDFEITSPGDNTYIKFSPNPQFPEIFNWDKPDYSGKLNFEVVFHYKEIGATLSDTIYKSVNLIYEEYITSQYDYEMTYSYWDNLFFSSCVEAIPYDDPAQEVLIGERFAGKIDFMVGVAAPEYSAYLAIFQNSMLPPNGDLVYSNIQDGVGIFSSRYKKTKSKRLHPETVAVLDNLGLKFQY